jgi:hypothetical protein
MGQLPSELQVAALIWLLFEQDAWRQVLGGKMHCVCDMEALQTPPVQETSLPVHRLRRGVAARWGVPLTPVQTPIEPVTSHAWHWPPQLELQHTPSMQLPLAQSPPLQAWPCGRATHVPLLQMGLAPGQSAFVQQFAAGMQAPLHALFVGVSHGYVHTLLLHTPIVPAGLAVHSVLLQHAGAVLLTQRLVPEQLRKPLLQEMPHDVPLHVAWPLPGGAGHCWQLGPQ